MRPLRHALCLISFVLVLACSSPQPEEAATPAQKAPASKAPSAQIDWFEGSVSEAFTQAADADKPVFLYWGAVWCPPCNVIKSTVFNQPEFVERTRDFIAVYLDGDTEDAQRWGEHYAAMGYPTLIVFDSAGQELTRLSTGMDVARYREVLQLSQQVGSGVPALVGMARENPAQLSQAQWELLAWHSWPVDQGRAVASADKASLFARLASSCPDPALAQRFALLAAIETLGDETRTAEARAALFELMDALLNEAQAVSNNLSELQYEGAALVLAATAPQTYQRSRLIKLYRQVLNQAWANESLPLKQRMNSLYGLADIAAAPAPDKVPDTELQQQMLERINWLREQDMSPQQRQSMLPGAAQLLHEIGLSVQARAIFQAEMKASVAPYYYMAYLAGLEHDLGRVDEALAWSRRAWQEAQGPATTAQWGLAHLGRLLEWTPQASSEIAQVLQTVFAQLAEHPGAFYQRSRVRLERKLPQLKAWAVDEPRRRALQQAGPAVVKACQALPLDQPVQQLCQAYQALTASAEA